MKPCSILLIDDEPALRDILSRVLKEAGHLVTGAANGKEASKVLGGAAFDVVLTDVIMPEKDGMQMISEVRKNFPEVRIVAMSGGGHVPRDQYLKIAKGLGAHAVLEKPFSNQQLLATIESLARRQPERTRVFVERAGLRSARLLGF
jgi:DNA-binding NtrC family response regulator